jgi:Ca2+-binding RTX toxin-like protein
VVLGSDESEGDGDDTDRINPQGGADTVRTGAGDDYVEGGPGRDRITGGSGADDLVGGSSSASGTATLARLTATVADRDTSAAGVQDDVDTIDGGTGDDVVLGDNGRVTRPATPASFLVGAVRDVAMADLTAGASSGSDALTGGDGDDVVYGQLDDTTTRPGSGDVIRGGPGDDAVVADLAVVTPTPASAISAPKRLTASNGMVDETVYPAGSVVPVTSAPASLAAVGGSDVVYGDAGDDVLRLGAGADLANGGSEQDVVLGGDGEDALWGGLGHDRLFGGYGDDDLDRKVGAGAPSLWSSVAGQEDLDNRISTTNGADLIYGGWGADELQADQGGAGPQPGSDQLLDWVGNHNVYYVCNGAYGAGKVLRQSSPDVMDVLTQLVTAAGDQEVGSAGSGGFLDLGLVTTSGINANSKPTPGAPGNFTCEAAG